jgi:hypothetical protein
MAMLVGLQLVGVAGVPFKVTEPTVAPKFVPATVTGVPTGPEVGDMLLMVGADGEVLENVAVTLVVPFIGRLCWLVVPERAPA